MLFKLIEGTPLHCDLLYLMQVLGQPMHEAIETAVRKQAELTRHLDSQLVVRLWGGPPFDRIRLATEAPHAN